MDDAGEARRNWLSDLRKLACFASVEGDPTLVALRIDEGRRSPRVLQAPTPPQSRSLSAREAPLAPSSSPSLPLHDLEALALEVSACTRCALHRERSRTVFARGNPASSLVFVGEGPGYHEDQQGLPFVGAAGQLLDRMVAAMGMGRDEVYICNVVKCRPPGNRTPSDEEAEACYPFLRKQLQSVAPRAIVALGKVAALRLRGGGALDKGWRGRWFQWEGVDVMPTYHPAFLLRNPEFKRSVWNDLQQVMQRLTGA